MTQPPPPPRRRPPPPPPPGRRPPGPGGPPPGGPGGPGGPPRRPPPPPFFLERVGAAPLALIPGRPFSVGRADDCQLTIPSQRVSRKHAEIAWGEDGEPLLRDLGSQNGTLVNGKRIKGDYKLQHGDELEFGPFLCTYRSRKDMAKERAQGGGAPMAPDVTQPMLGDAMAGRLDQINLTELLQTLEFNAKTGTLEVFGSEGEGSIVIKEGKPTFAECEGEEGEEAFYKLLSFKEGQFSFSPDISEGGKNLTQNMGSLLMEAMRRLDER
ncbi:MAG: DUF4388 domain-containing protein [Planctomycetota bacterium]